VMFGDSALGEDVVGFDAVLDLTAWWGDIFTPPCVAFAADPAQAGALIAAGADFVAFGPALWSDPHGSERVLREAAASLAPAIAR
jgi:thiamine-phosphate pyrophosphorylase